MDIEKKLEVQCEKYYIVGQEMNFEGKLDMNQIWGKIKVIFICIGQWYDTCSYQQM